MGSETTLLRELGRRDVPTYAAKDAAGQLVVVERYTRVEGEDDDALAPAAHAAEALTELVHPSLAHVREVVTTGGDVLVVSDFVDGEVYDTLAPAGEAFARVPVAAKLRIVADVLDGLGALHAFARERAADEVSPVHGAVSPDVVVVGLDGRARLVRTCTLFPEQVNPASPVLGYMAPELVDGTAPFDPRVDVYGVGVMLWEAITGKRLVVQSNVSSLLLKELDRGPPKGLSAGELVWGKALVAVVRRALAPREERFADAGAMGDELRAAAAEAFAAREDVAQVVEVHAGAAIRARREALVGLEPQLASAARATVAPKRSTRAPAVVAPVVQAAPPAAPEPASAAKLPARARPARPAARVEAGAPRADRERDAAERARDPDGAPAVAALDGEGDGEGGDANGGDADERGRSRRRTRAVIAVVAGAVALGALVVGYRLGRHEPTPPAASVAAPVERSAASAPAADPTAASPPPTREIELVEPPTAGAAGGGSAAPAKGRRHAHAPAPPPSSTGRFNPQGI